MIRQGYKRFTTNCTKRLVFFTCKKMQDCCLSYQATSLLVSFKIFLKSLQMYYIFLHTQSFSVIECMAQILFALSSCPAEYVITWNCLAIRNAQKSLLHQKNNIIANRDSVFSSIRSSTVKDLMKMNGAGVTSSKRMRFMATRFSACYSRWLLREDICKIFLTIAV